MDKSILKNESKAEIFDMKSMIEAKDFNVKLKIEVKEDLNFQEGLTVLEKINPLVVKIDPKSMYYDKYKPGEDLEFQAGFDEIEESISYQNSKLEFMDTKASIKIRKEFEDIELQAGINILGGMDDSTFSNVINRTKRKIDLFWS